MAIGNRDLKWIPPTVQATAGNNSSAIIIPGYIGNVTVTAIPGGGGTATVQHTTNSEQEVIDNPGACTWVDWDAGAVGAATSRGLNGPVTAVRIAAAVAAATLQVVGERFR